MHPILFHIGSYSVHTYGVILMGAFLASLGRAYAAAKRQNDPRLTPDDVVDVGIWMIVTGIIGARLMFVAIGWKDYYSRHPLHIFSIWEGGASFHGSLLGALLAMTIFCVRKRIPMLLVADLFAPSAMLGYVIGRLGCFFNGCCYGGPTRLPWGVRFLDDGHWTPPSHPTQIYSSLLSLVFFVLLVRLERRKAFAGQVTCWYILFSGIERFLMEIWRAGTTSDVLALGLTDVQWLCLAMIVGATAGLVFLRRAHRGDITAKNTPARVVGR